MKKGRIVFVVVLITMLATSLVGCQAAPATPTEPVVTDPPPAEPTKVIETVETPQAESTEVPEVGPDYAAARDAFLEAVDLGFAKRLNAQLPTFSNNPLGFRTAGSAAERAAAEWLAEQMEAIGLQEVQLESFPVDTWDYRGGHIDFTPTEGDPFRLDEMVALANATFTADTPITGEVIYVGDGTRQDYEGIDATGKIVVADVDMNSWWLAQPAYEAYVQGAQAILMDVVGGYTMGSDDAILAFDIAGDRSIPSLTISRNSVKMIKEALEAGPLTATITATNISEPGTSQNVVGKIIGRNPEEMILFTAHYDGYFRSYNDNASGTAAILTIAKALIDSGYQPDHTLVFIATGSEEFGVLGSRTDFQTGAWQAINNLHPDWSGKVVSLVNMDSVALDESETTSLIRTTQEYVSTMDAFTGQTDFPEDVYPEGYELSTPLFSWSDDFSFSVSGVPGINAHRRSDVYSENIYHTQQDTINLLDEDVFEHKIKLYGQVGLYFDQVVIAPLDFSVRMELLRETIVPDVYAQADVDLQALETEIDALIELGREKYEQIDAFNQLYAALLDAQRNGEDVDASLIAEMRTVGLSVNPILLSAYRDAQDGLTRLTWIEIPIYANEHTQENITLLTQAIEQLQAGEVQDVLDNILVNIEDEYMSYSFSKELVDNNTSLVMDQPVERNQWGGGRVVGYVDLYDLIGSLEQKAADGSTDFTAEIAELEDVLQSQYNLHAEVTAEQIAIIQSVQEQLSHVDLSASIEAAQAALGQ